jgi:hypothetical protein
VNVTAGATKSNINATLVSLVKQTKPGAPRSVHASKPSPKAVNVTWNPPASIGGTPITAYEVTYGGRSVRVSGSARSATIGGLPKSTYYFRVRAINRIGPGPWSARSNPVKILV